MINLLPGGGGGGADDDEERPPASAAGPPPPSAPGDEHMQRFYSEVDRAKEAVTRVKGATAKIKELQDQAMVAVGSREQEVSEELGRVLTQANKDCATAKRVLEGIKKDTEKLDRKKQQANIRIRENVHATVLQNLVGTVRAYQAAQQEYKMKLRTKATNTVRIAEPGASDEQVDVIIRNGDVNSVYRQKMLQPGSDVVAQAYLHAMDKYQDVLKLERSVEELHKMFMDLAVLVEAQGQMLSNIETQVYTAKDYIDSGNKNLNQALKAQKATRRRMCCFIVCLIVVLGIILGPVMGVLGGSTFSGRRRLGDGGVVVTFTLAGGTWEVAV